MSNSPKQQALYQRQLFLGENVSSARAYIQEAITALGQAMLYCHDDVEMTTLEGVTDSLQDHMHTLRSVFSQPMDLAAKDESSPADRSMQLPTIRR